MSTLKQPLIDILLAAYNGELYLKEQIDSIFSQSYSHLHLYVRDDNSKDGTSLLLPKIAAQYPGKITIVPSNQSLGVVGNFSELLKHSTAPYVMFSDQDDKWLPFKVEKTLQEMQKQEKLAGDTALPILVHTDLCVVDANLKKIHPSFFQYTHLFCEMTSLNRLLMQNVVTGCTMMLNRPLADLCQPFPSVAIMHDWWIALAAAAFGRIGVVSEATILYRQHANNQVGAKDRRFRALMRRGFSLDQLYKMRDSLQKQKFQAEAFSKRFQEQLSSQQQTLLRAFCTLPYASRLQRPYIMGKFGFYKHGVIRNLALLFI